MTIKSEIEEKKILKLIVSAAEEFLQSPGNELNYQKIMDDILNISGAKYAGFNLYDEDGSKFTTVAFAAPDGILKKISSLLGFKLLGKKWDYDPVRAEKIKFSTINRFSSLTELVGDIIPGGALSLLEKTFNTGEVILVKILKDNVMLGDFTLIMPCNVKFKNDDYIELYSRQVGLSVVKSRDEAKLIENERRLRSVFAAVSDPIFLFDQKTGAILDVNDAACSLYGYSHDEMLKLQASNMSAEPETTRESMNNFTTFVPIRYQKKKDGTVFIVEITASLFELNGRNAITATMRDITKRKIAEDLLRNERERLGSIIEGTNVGTWEWNIQTGETFFNARSAEIIGYTLDEISPGNIKTWEGFTHPEDFIKSNDQLKRVFSKEISFQDFECRLKHKDGSWVWIHDRGKVISWTPDGKPLWMRGTYTDITERKKTEEALIESEIKYRQLFDNMTTGFALHEMIYDEEGNPVDYRFLEVNSAFEKLTGLKASLIIGKTVKEVIPDTEQYWIDTYSVVAKTGESISFENYAGGLKKWYEIWVFSPSKNKFATIFSDITVRKKAEKKIIHLSFHDHLTELYNRRFFEEELKRLDTERQLPLTFIMGDLNGLKIINDVFGHDEGDVIIKVVAEILKNVCRSDDILARWGGDEFVILLPKTTAADAEEVVQRIRTECGKTIGRKVPASLSLGAATKEKASQDIQSIVIDAESNMYKNKLAQKESLTSSIIFALEQALYEKSSETKEHTDRMHELSLRLGKSVKLSSNQLDELSLLASLHDIGKVAIPETILLKKGKLTEKEWNIIKRHPEIGFNIAQSSPQISHIAKSILSCHENFDGSGYPMGLKGHAIPIISKIILIIDAYDVMTSGRTYKPAISKEDAVAELKRCAGTQFDPELVDKFIEILKD